MDEATFLLVHLGHCLHWLLKVGPGRFFKVYTSSIINITPNTNTTNQGLPDLLPYDPGLGRLRHLDLVSDGELMETEEIKS